MSEEATEAKAVKKKGKLPIILVLVLVLGGGGFFAMKGKGAPKKVVIKAGGVAPLDKEFLVNLAGGPNVYLRAEMALELRDGFAKEKLEEYMPAIRDCINQILRSKSIQQVGASQTDVLRKEISKSINEIIKEHMTDEEKKAQEEFEKAAGEKPEPAKPGTKGHKDEADQEQQWASPAGPVLDVYFTSFTTQ